MPPLNQRRADRFNQRRALVPQRRLRFLGRKTQHWLKDTKPWRGVWYKESQNIQRSLVWRQGIVCIFLMCSNTLSVIHTGAEARIGATWKAGIRGYVAYL